MIDRYKTSETYFLKSIGLQTLKAVNLITVFRTDSSLVCIFLM